MKKEIYVLIVEDVSADVVLINHELRKGGLSFRSRRVSTKVEFTRELEKQAPDVILSDHGLPEFDGFTALALAQTRCPEVPFIFVTGSMGEEVAIESLRSGATDYVLKNRLSGLVASVTRSLRLAEERRLRLRAEKALNLSEEQFRTLVEGVKDYAIFMLDALGRVTTWNTGAQCITGYDAPEIVGRDYACLFQSEEIARGLPGRILNAAASDGRCEREGRRVRKGGARYWASMVVSVLRDPAGEVHGYAVVVRDITERRQAEEELRRSESRKRLIIESALDAVIMLDAAGQVTEWNPAAETLFGYARTEAVGRELAALVIPEEQRETHRAGIARYLRTGRSKMLGRRVQLTACRADGSRFPVELAVTATAGSESSTFIGFVRDLTEQVAAQAALAASEARHTAILEAALDAIISVDQEGSIREWNAAAERMFGFPRGDAIGRKLDALIIPPSLLALYHDGLARYLMTGVGSLIGRPIELPGRRADGTELTVELALTRIPESLPHLYTAVIRDISARKQAENEIRRLNSDLENRVRERTRELETANQELESFSYSVSHDLRAPLRHIIGLVEMLKGRLGERLSGDEAELMGRIAGAGDRMWRLIDALLAFSRLGQAEMRKSRVSLATLFESAMAEIQPELAGRQVEWETDRLPEVDGDPALLRQVLVNLLSNALKYTRPRAVAHIRFGVRLEPGEIVCFVRDNGVGFDMRYADRLFGVFQRLHRESEFEGTGVGLANVRLIVQRHGGRTWAEATADQGATFYFSLPYVRATATPHAC